MHKIVMPEGVMPEGVMQEGQTLPMKYVVYRRQTKDTATYDVAHVFTETTAAERYAAELRNQLAHDGKGGDVFVGVNFPDAPYPEQLDAYQLA